MVSRRARSATIRIADDAARAPIRFEPNRLVAVHARGLGMRFAFGFGVSVLAGIVGLALGSRVGGVFLAFPAILPASLTLIADQDGRDRAEIDAAGATIGAVALAVFAAIAAVTITRLTVLGAVAIAVLAWTISAVAIYSVIRRTLRSVLSRQPNPHESGAE